MDYWKLGCRWGGKSEGKPLFFDLLQKENILISWENKDFKENTLVLLTDGYTPIGVAKTVSTRKPISRLQHLKGEFEEKQILFEGGIYYYEAEIYAIGSPNFKYLLQQGIVQINQKDTQLAVDTIFKKLQEASKMNEYLNLLNYKKQIILQGPPGTGKTRLAKEMAVKMFGLSNTEELKDYNEFKLIQFHPSYTYEDFVRGITATPNKSGEGILYEAENKTLGAFAEEALENYKLSREESTEAEIDKWIEEKFEEFKAEIEAKLPEDETDLSGAITIYEVTQNSFLYTKNCKAACHIMFSDFKKLLKDILEERLLLSGQVIPKKHSIHAHYRYTYYNALSDLFFKNYEFDKKSEKQEEKAYVLIIDEINRANLSSVLGELIYALEYRGETVEGLYEIQGKRDLTLPPNLFIIGTMNTADRSIGHIDYAIRRRFAFVPIFPEELQENDEMYFNTEGFEKVTALFNEVNVSDEFEIEDVQIGHSYFIAGKEKATDEEKRDEIFKLKMNYEVVPLLQEYVTDGVLIGEFEKKDIYQYIKENLRIR